MRGQDEDEGDGGERRRREDVEATLRGEVARLADQCTALRKALLVAREKEEAARLGEEEREALERKLQVALVLIGEKDEEVEALRSEVALLREEMDLVRQSFHENVERLLQTSAPAHNAPSSSPSSPSSSSNP